MTSTVERMAQAHYAASYRGGPPVVRWQDLNDEDRKRWIDAMKAAVAAMPDDLAEVRDKILAEHGAAKAP